MQMLSRYELAFFGDYEPSHSSSTQASRDNHSVKLLFDRDASFSEQKLCFFPAIPLLPTLAYNNQCFIGDSNPKLYLLILLPRLSSQQDPKTYSTVNPIVQLGSSQVPVFSTQCTEDSSFGEDKHAEHREKNKWIPPDDLLLISAWLKTSKDHVVCNEQKSGAFWKRVANYFSSCAKVGGRVIREPSHCKNRWQKINDIVCKFCGCYEAATREIASGQNEDDILNRAFKIFFNNHKKKFNFELAWRELRYDQKWCELSTSKTDGSCKRRKVDDGAQSSTSLADEASKRPSGVKAAKSRGKKSVDEGKDILEFRTI